METLMTKMGWTQDDLAAALSMSQPGARKLLTGDTQIKRKHALPLSAETGFSLDWLLTGEGPEGITLDFVTENENVMTTEERAILERFNAGIELLKKRKGFEHYVQVAEYLRLNNNHLTDVRNGKRPVSMGQLLSVVKYGDLSADYILSKRGAPEITGDSRDDLRQRIEELERDKALLQRHIDMLDMGTKKQIA
ncbi:MAG: helix-turn-helix domain-containing protein [Bacteroidetes bacterium]|nr:helix-turn-helix domain-containing protein [Bacteroidota bacterium]